MGIVVRCTFSEFGYCLRSSCSLLGVCFPAPDWWGLVGEAELPAFGPRQNQGFRVANPTCRLGLLNYDRTGQNRIVDLGSMCLLRIRRIFQRLFQEHSASGYSNYSSPRQVGGLEISPGGQ